MYPLTKDKPKPLLEINGKPLMEYIIKKVEEIEEIEDVFVVTNNKFYSHFERWLKNFNSSKKIEIINDQTRSNEDRLGSLGDINFVIDREKINEDLLVIAGDNIFEFSLKDFVKAYKGYKESTIVLYDVKDRELAKQYGIVKIDNKNRVIGFKEKPTNPESTLSSIAVYLYPPRILPMIKEFIEKFGNTDKAGNFLEFLHKKEDVYTFITEDTWFDIGNFEQLERARRWFESRD